MLSISNERLKHSLEVARLMKKTAEVAGWSKEKCEEMFILGFLHDIGYEFAEQQSNHASVGGELLRIQGYKYWQEVANHGKCDSVYLSDELNMLNIADMSVDSNGNIISVEHRLLDIASRYGQNSTQYIEARLLAEKLNLI